MSLLPPSFQNGRRLAILQTEVPWTHISPQTVHDCPAPGPGGRTKKSCTAVGGPKPSSLPALPMWEALVPSQYGSGELTALKGFLNLCSSKPAARRSFGVCSTRSLNLEGRRPEVYLMVMGTQAVAVMGNCPVHTSLTEVPCVVSKELLIAMLARCLPC